jgi:phospholipase A-2-activating protein
VVACSDGSIRLFTQNEKLMANKSEIEEYQTELSRFTIPLKANEAMSQIKRAELPGIEALTLPGQKDGQTLMINNGAEVEVHQWDGAESKWIKIGVAVGSSDGSGGAGSGKKVSYLGKEYDYVFDIELDDAGSKLKLPFDLSEDPYFAAQKFIHKHELSQSFLDQIAQFLITNTHTETIGSDSMEAPYVDPFTGEGRYVPQMGNSSASSAQSKRPLSSYVDPLTGSGAYFSNNGTAKPDYPMETEPSIRINTPQSNEYYPVNNYIFFDQLNYEPIIKKLKEFQQNFSSSEHKNELITDKNNIELIEHLMKNYENFNVSTQLNDQIDLLFQMIETWPREFAFPLIDLLRILVLNKQVAAYICRNQNVSYLTTKQAQPNSNNYFEILFKLMSLDYPVNTMIVLRLVSNLFKSVIELKSNQKVLAFILNERLFLLKKLTSLLESQNKVLQASLSTVMLNYAILINNLAGYSDKLNNAHLTELASEHIQYLSDSNALEFISNWDAEALFRVLACIGTILSDSNVHLDLPILISIVQSTGEIKKLCHGIASKADKYPEKIRKCNGYLKRLVD